MWPRYFIASEDAQAVPDVSQAPLRYAVDLFRANLSPDPAPKKEKPAGKSGESGHVPPAAEWVVAADALGNLNVLPALRSSLPPDLKRQVNTNELLSPPRTLNVRELFLFDIEHAEAQGNPAGLNDPVNLQGRIFGPFPSERPMSARGQLAVTRADVLDGLVRGLPCAFHYAEAHRSHGELRCLHLMLPGTTAQELKKGKSALLAFPMLSTALGAGHPSNQPFAAGFLYDLLAQLQADFLQENIRGAFPDLKLPVPSRRRHEAGLKARGYEVHGDTVYAPIAKPSRSWIGKLFQNIGREKESLPPEGTLNDFVRLAQLAVRSIPGWPDARSQVLRTLTRLHRCSWKPGEDALIKPVAVTDRQPHLAVFEMNNAGVVSPAKPSNNGERFICFQIDPSFAFRRHADLEIRIEYQGGPGELCIDYVLDQPEPTGRQAAHVKIDASKDVRTASFSIQNAIIDRQMWNTDFALVVRSKKDFILRSITLIGSGEPAVDAPVKIDRGDSGIKVESGGKGSLDFAGRWHGSYMGPVLLFPRKPGFEINFRGHIIDTQRKATDGSASLVLKTKAGELSFPASRYERPDVVRHYDNVEAYAHSGVDVKVPSDSVPAGEYKAYIRLVRPDGKTCVEADTLRRIRFYDEAALVNSPSDPPFSIEALSSYWSWGMDVHGFDPCFRNGACSGSGEVTHRIWLKKDRGYQIAVGLMEPDQTERGKRVIEVVVGGRTIGKYDLVQFPGTKRPYAVIVPACLTDKDDWLEVKVARHSDSTGDHNVVLYGLWVFPEGEPLTEDAVVRGTLTEKALLYWAPGQALHRCLDTVLLGAMPHLAIKAGRSGLQITWRGQVVAQENRGDNASIAAAFFVDQQFQPRAYGLSVSAQPQAEAELIQRLISAPPYTLVALAMCGELDRDYLKKLKEALKGWGIQVALPGESGRKNLIAVGVKGMSVNYGIELDGTDDLQFPIPPPLNPGLVGHWKLDDGARKIVDNSGRGHHGALKSGKWVKTPAGEVLELDGSGYITIPYHDDFHITGDLTLMMWMRPNEVPERDILMAGRGDPFRPCLFWYNRHHVVFQQCNRFGVGISWLGTRPMPLRKWVHIAAVVSRQTATLYADGIECHKRDRFGIPGQSSAPFTIGGFENTWHPLFKGAMTDVRLYNRALSPDELLQIIHEMPKERLVVPAKPKRKAEKKSE
jgi:hypothetical protein